MQIIVQAENFGTVRSALMKTADALSKQASDTSERYKNDQFFDEYCMDLRSKANDIATIAKKLIIGMILDESVVSKLIDHL